MAGYTGSKSLAAGDVLMFDSADTWDVGGGSQGFYLVGGVTYVGNGWGLGKPRQDSGDERLRRRARPLS